MHEARGAINERDVTMLEPKGRRSGKRPLARRLRSDDAQTYRALLIEALILHPDSFREHYRTQIQRSLADVADELERSGIFGAWIDAKLVGIAGFSSDTCVKCRHRGNVSRLYVKQEFRKMGVASMLLQEIMQYAAHHVDQLEVEITTSDEHVVSIFERSGFRMYGLSPRGIRVDEAEFDVWSLVRFLR